MMPEGWGSGGIDLGATRGEFCTTGSKVVCVLLANGCNGVASSSGPWVHKGRVHLIDQREIDWPCVTHDGTKGKVRIQGKEFDLSKGGLFLIDTRAKSVRVQQLDVPIGIAVNDRQGYEKARKSIEALAQENPVMRQFVREAAPTP